MIEEELQSQIITFGKNKQTLSYQCWRNHLAQRSRSLSSDGGLFASDGWSDIGFCYFMYAREEHLKIEMFSQNNCGTLAGTQLVFSSFHN